MAHEIDAIELVAEALAGGESRLEIGFSENVSFDLADGDHGRVAGLAADEGYLAKEVARPQPRDLMLGADHFYLALRHEKKFFARLTLADDRVPCRKVALRHLFRDIGELPRRQALE